MAVNDGRVIPAFAGQALQDQPLTVFGDGSQTRSFCYVEDTVNGLIKLALSSTVQPCNLGNPNEMTVAEVAQIIVKLTGSQSTISFKPLPEDDPKRRKPDINRAKELLDWEPVVAFEDGLKQTLSYFKQKLG